VFATVLLHAGEPTALVSTRCMLLVMGRTRPNKTPGDAGENRSHPHGLAVFLARRGGERTIRGSRFDLLPCRLAGTGGEWDLFPCRLAGTGSESDRFPSPLAGTVSLADRFPSRLAGTGIWFTEPDPDVDTLRNLGPLTGLAYVNVATLERVAGCAAPSPWQTRIEAPSTPGRHSRPAVRWTPSTRC
jgi:hypothetical protein